MRSCFFVRAFVSGVALTMLAGCADERRDHPVFIDDLNDVERLPQATRERLQAEHGNLPRSMVVRVPADDRGEPRADAQAEVRHFDRHLGRVSSERMPAVWREGRSSERTRLAHNLRHIARDYKYGRRYSTQHDYDDHRYGLADHNHRYGSYRGDGYYRYNYNSPLIYNYGDRYSRYYPTYWRNYYRPYYRSVYNPSWWWGNYRYYTTYYYQPSGYRYFIYYPNNTYVRTNTRLCATTTYC